MHSAHPKILNIGQTFTQLTLWFWTDVRSDSGTFLHVYPHWQINGDGRSIPDDNLIA